MVNDIMLPKYDFMFKQYLGKKGKEEHLKNFLELILNQKLPKVEILGPVELNKYFKKDKSGALDIQAKTKDAIINIEMQNQKKGHNCMRTMAYWSKSFLGQGREGKKYKEYTTSISIWIIDYNFNNGNNYISEYTIRTDNDKKSKLECFKLYVIELPKFRKIKKEYNNDLHLWLSLFVAECRDDLMVIKGKNKYIDDCIEEVIKMSEEEEEREIRRMHEKWEIDEILTKQWEREQGEKIGQKRGEKIGKRKALVKAVQKMYMLNSDIEFISKVTELSKEDIKRITKDIPKNKINI